MVCPVFIRRGSNCIDAFPLGAWRREMIAEDGSTVLLAATGHIRRFIAQRMNEDGQQSSKANLAPITAKIIAYPTGLRLNLIGSSMSVLGLLIWGCLPSSMSRTAEPYWCLIPRPGVGGWRIR